MRFGRIDLAQAEGALVAHSVVVAGHKLAKGHRLTAADIEALRAEGHDGIIAARLDEDDRGEDEVAEALAQAVAGAEVVVKPPFTGRANLHATKAGVLVVDADAVRRINLIDESITLATLPEHSVVHEGEMVATVKIIPFAVPAATLAACLAAASRCVSVRPFTLKRAVLVQTMLAKTKASVLDKGRDVFAARLAPLGMELTAELRCRHDEAETAQAIRAALDTGCDLVAVAAASANVDRRDVVPAAIVRCQGRVERFGMPVDPGNLLVIGEAGGRPVLGMPGCARSPKLNGFDWVLERLAAGIPVTSPDIAAMGVGGLLKEIPSRPQPREQAEKPKRQRFAVAILAAGLSRRMGANKLVQMLDGKPVVRHVAEAALAAEVGPVTVVVGHQGDAVREALAGLPLTFVENPDAATGMASSVRAAAAALEGTAEAALFCLGDMPRVPPDVLRRLAQAYDPVEGRLICQPTVHGKRGNPILWSARFFPELMALTGDEGARGLLQHHADVLALVPVESDGILLDVDTPEDLAKLRG